MVPRSHSRAITIAVSSAPIRVMITTTRPGTRKLRLRTSELNHTRCSSATGVSKRRPRSAARRASHTVVTPSM